MKFEIIKLLYTYSFNKKIFDKQAISRIYNIFINNYYGIEKYLKSIIITNQDYIAAVYNYKEKNIIINIERIVKEFTEGIKVFNLDEIQGYFFLNTQLLVGLFHELEHAIQWEIRQQNTLFGKLIYYGNTFNKNFSCDEKGLSERNNIYNTTYYYNPCERDAYITSSKIVKSILKDSIFIDENILINLKWLVVKSQISGYTKENRVISPSEIFLKYINKEDLLKEYSCNNTILNKVKVKKVYTLEERLRYGLYISSKEYDSIINTRNELQNAIIKK